MKKLLLLITSVCLLSLWLTSDFEIDEVKYYLEEYSPVVWAQVMAGITIGICALGKQVIDILDDKSWE